MSDLGLSVEQLKHAVTIISVGKLRGESVRNIQIAVMTAITESGLQNYANSYNSESLSIPHDNVGSDHGSVGLFQQQVGGAPNSTANWGTTRELMTPSVAANKFYDALDKKGDTSHMYPWNVGQSVQGSAFNDGSNYQASWNRAVAVVTALHGSHLGPTGAITSDLVGTPPYKADQIKEPLTDAQRNKIIDYIAKQSGKPGTSAYEAKVKELQGLKGTGHAGSDGNHILYITYLGMITNSLPKADPGYVTPGVGPIGVPGLSDLFGGLQKMLSFLTSVKNWERIGLFVLGAILLLLAAIKLVGTNPVGAAVRTVT